MNSADERAVQRLVRIGQLCVVLWEMLTGHAVFRRFDI
jgi:hypothetical protein